jgi:hypothetical protein
MVMEKLILIHENYMYMYQMVGLGYMVMRKLTQSWKLDETITKLLYCENKVKIRRHMTGFEEFENTKGIIRIRKLKKNRQHNSQKKKHKMTNNNLQNKHIKLKIE